MSSALLRFIPTLVTLTAGALTAALAVLTWFFFSKAEAAGANAVVLMSNEIPGAFFLSFFSDRLSAGLLAVDAFSVCT